MGVRQESKHEVVTALRDRYWAPSRTEKGQILDMVVEATAQLNRIYALLHVYVNGYLPVMKLIGKERDGAKVHKQDDQAKTPYRRALEAGVVTAEQRERFEVELATQGPLALRRHIERELERLRDLAASKKPAAAAATG